jgi:hypothetical protein
VPLLQGEGERLMEAVGDSEEERDCVGEVVATGQEVEERDCVGETLLLGVTRATLTVGVCDCDSEALAVLQRVGEPVLDMDTVVLREGVFVREATPLREKVRVAEAQAELETDMLKVALPQGRGVVVAHWLVEALAQRVGEMLAVPEGHWLTLGAREGVEVALAQAEARGEGVAQGVALLLGLVSTL